MKVIVFLPLLVLVCYCNGYNWKEWTGTVPKCAVKAGRDNRGVSYIAQAYVPNTGIYIGQIFPGQEQILLNTAQTSADGNLTNSSYDIKILCSDENDLLWMVSNFTRTEEILAKGDVHVIKGGVDNRNATVYIGKYSDGVNIFVGSVHYTNFLFYATAEGVGKTYFSYELLTLGNESSDY